MLSAVEIREQVKAGGMNFKTRHAKLVERFQTGIAGGIADHMNFALAIAHDEFFIDTWRAYGKNAKASGLAGKAAQYTTFSGANKPDKKGNLKFVRGRIVNRTGKMAEAISPVEWSEGSALILGKNGSPDMVAIIKSLPGRKEATIAISGRTAKLMGIHINKSKIRILMLAFNTAGRNFRKLVNAKIIKNILPLKVVLR